MKGSGIAAILAMGVWAPAAMGQNRPAADPQVRVRDGFSLSVAAEVRGARFLAFDPNGTLFVSQPDSRQISACRDGNGDGYYETDHGLREGPSDRPRGVLVRRLALVHRERRDLPGPRHERRRHRGRAADGHPRGPTAPRRPLVATHPHPQGPALHRHRRQRQHHRRDPPPTGRRSGRTTSTGRTSSSSSPAFATPRSWWFDRARTRSGAWTTAATGSDASSSKKDSGPASRSPT